MSAAIPIHDITTNTPARSISRSSSLVRRGSPLARSFDPSELDDTATDESHENASPHRRTAFLPGHHRHHSAGLLDASYISSSPPLTGSYLTSLLSGRIASSSNHTTTFKLHLSASASLEATKHKAKPKPLQLIFHSIWYDITGPYTATIDVSEHLREQNETNSSAETSNDPTVGDYLLPSSKGQIQLIISNEMGTLIKMFTISYDFTSIKKSGTQMIRRQVWCTRVKRSSPVPTDKDTERNGVSTPPSGQPLQDTIRYAAQLHFACRAFPAPRRNPRASDAMESPSGHVQLEGTSAETSTSVFPVDMEVEDTNNMVPAQALSTGPALSSLPAKSKPGRSRVRKFYLAGTIRLVFNSRPPEDDEELVMTTDSTDIFAP